MSQVQFHKAHDAHEACVLLSQYGARARILAGGTDLMARLNGGTEAPEALISVAGSGMSYIRTDGGKLVIGATATHTEIVRSGLVQQMAPLLAAATRQIGSLAIRNAGTTGGNLCNASPAADAAVALVALGAKATLVSTEGRRELALEKFFVGPGKTVIQPNELLLEISIPVANDRLRWRWYKIGKRRADTISVVSVAIALQMEGDRCRHARIALGSVAPRPLLVEGAAAELEGRRLDEALAARVAEMSSNETTPIDDVRATAWYRKKVCANITRRLLTGIGDS